MKMPVKNHRCGFTLVELLVTIAIIAVLCGLLLSAIAQASARSKAIQCTNNLKQLGLSYSLYFADENSSVTYQPWPGLWIQTLLERCAAIQKVRICPVAPEQHGAPAVLTRDSQRTGWVTRAWLVDKDKTRYFGSYALNGYFYESDKYSPTEYHFKNEAAIPNPVKTPFFADSTWVDAWPLEKDLPARNLFDADVYTAAGLSRIAIPRHGVVLRGGIQNFNPKNALPGSVNVVFADNHVERIRLESLWSLDWHKNWVTPAKRPGR